MSVLRANGYPSLVEQQVNASAPVSGGGVDQRIKKPDSQQLFKLARKTELKLHVWHQDGKSPAGFNMGWVEGRRGVLFEESDHEFKG